jgi:hypothetical protein
MVGLCLFKYWFLAVHAYSFQLSAALQVFVLAMLLFPEVQAKAQKEIDSTIGFDRLPNANDKAELSFIRNLIQEVASERRQSWCEPVVTCYST